MQTDVYLPQRRKYKDVIFPAHLWLFVRPCGNITNASADRLCFRDETLNFLVL